MGVINWNEKNPPNEQVAELEQSVESKGAEAAKVETEAGKLATELEELRQTLLRRQVATMLRAC